MNRPHFLFRPNMQNEDHRRAWRLLQEVPEGQKSAFIVRAILQMNQEDRLETMLRRVLREEKITVAGQPDAAQETGLPDGMMGFLDALMDGLPLTGRAFFTALDDQLEQEGCPRK